MRKIFYLIAIFSIFNSQALASNMTIQNAHQFSFTGLDNQKINLADFKGKVILVVNSASKCGLTPQYKGLEDLHQKYKDKGLVVLAVPSADFGNQEYAKSNEIKEFVSDNFKTTFQITTLEKVKGLDAHPFYLWANNSSGFMGSPKWNFHKYLIDKNGNFAGWFASTTSPTSPKVIKKIEELL